MAEVIPLPGSRTALPAGAALSLGGLMSAVPLSTLRAQEKQAAEQANLRPEIQGLAGHIRQVWDTNEEAKSEIEDRMLRSIRQRRGEYDPEKLAVIRQQGGSEIYMMLTAAKCRAAASWLRDVLMSQGSEKPWTLEPSPSPTLEPSRMEAVFNELAATVQTLQMTGQALGPSGVKELVELRKQELMSQLRDDAKRRAEAMEREMEDQLVEGGFMQALNQFIDDLATFPAAIIKGPVIRQRKTLKWVEGQAGWELAEEKALVPEWDRVDPFDLFPAPHAENIDQGDLVERHRLSRADLIALKGVEGYSEAAINAVLEEHGRGGLLEWTSNDSAREAAEGRTGLSSNPGKQIDALQFWGSVQGQLLIDWGMPEEQVEDPLAEYEIEAWLIGRWVVKAVINPDPLGRRPYYKTSYEKIPGLFWGNAPPDLVRDSQAMCNAAARALANNMGVSSGPQVVVNVDRLPPGEDITNIYPWKVHQVRSDPVGGSAKAIEFFQPSSNAQDLFEVYERYSVLADEYTGIPRYMSGDSPGGGVGRTASGLSMLISHAGKVMKQVIAQIDNDVFVPLLERLYNHNMKFHENQEIKGDVRIVARGLNSLLLKESAQVRLNEFLQLTGNPVDMQIIGLPGRAELLREAAKRLDVNVDRIVPDLDVLRAKEAMAQMQPQAMPVQQEPGQKPSPQPQALPTALPMNQPPATQIGSGQNLQDGSPTEDNFNA